MGFFAFQWCVLVVGLVLHVLLDRRPGRHTAPRVLELASVWVVVCSGAFAVLGGVYHVGPTSDSVADSIGYARSMFQWEIGWADIAIGVACVLCARRANRGAWMTAAVSVLSISFLGDGIGHVMQLVAHDNTAPDNVWAIPACFLTPLLAVSLTWLARRSAADTTVVVVTTVPAQEQIPAGPRSS